MLERLAKIIRYMTDGFFCFFLRLFRRRQNYLFFPIPFMFDTK